MVRPNHVLPWLGGDISPNPCPIAPWGRGYSPSLAVGQQHHLAPPLRGLSLRTQPPAPLCRVLYPCPTKGHSRVPGTQDPPTPAISLPSLILGKQQKGKKKNSNFSYIIDLQALGANLECEGCSPVLLSSGVQGAKPPSLLPRRGRHSRAPALYLKNQVAMTTRSSSAQPSVPQESTVDPAAPPPWLAFRGVNKA